MSTRDTAADPRRWGRRLPNVDGVLMTYPAEEVGSVSGPVEIILIIGAVGYILARRLLGEPAEAKHMLLLPAVLAGVGLIDLTKVPQSPVSIGFLVGTTALSLVVGLLRGASIRVFDKDG